MKNSTLNHPDGDLNADLGHNRRDLVIKVRVNSAEKTEMDRQKGRLSYPAFLRDRGLNQDMVYDPTYSAVGGVYQSARNLRDSSILLAQASKDLDQFAVDLAGLGRSPHEAESLEKSCREILETARAIRGHGARLESQAKGLREQAGDLASTHLEEMLKRYPAPDTKPRKRR